MSLQFCSNCGNLYELRIKDQTAIYHCNSCGNQEPLQEDYYCACKMDTSEDQRCYTSIKNAYTIHDSTLPRLNNLKCLNPACITNQKDCFILNSCKQMEKLEAMYPILSSDKVVQRLLEPEDLGVTHPDQNELEIHNLCGSAKIDCSRYIQSGKVADLDVPKVNIIKFKDPADAATFRSSLEAYQAQHHPSLEESLYIPQPVLREVIFIKYDTENMKYLYICSTCGSSWKNVN